MKIIGIIAEYNPFHAGHAYHIREAKRLSGAEACVAVMSGHFVQRGEPALLNPYVRAEAALQNGVDAVFMLPVRYSTASAGEFACGGVSLLNSLGCDFISYGIEKENDKNNPVREGSAGQLLPPNTILAAEYRKAMKTIGSAMTPIEIPRAGHDYHDTETTGEYPSATAIRRAVLTGSDRKLQHAFISDLLLHSGRLHQSTTAPDRIIIPQNRDAVTQGRNACSGSQLSVPCFVSPDSVLPVLEATVRRLVHDGIRLDSFLDVNRELADRIRGCDFRAETYEELVLSLKTKNYAYTRISRCLMHILLDIRKRENEDIYAHLIGFRKDAAAVLRELKKRSDLVLISKAADYRKVLAADAYASQVYEILAKSVCPEYSDNFYRQQLIVVV